MSSEKDLFDELENDNLDGVKRLVASGLCTQFSDKYGMAPLYFAKSNEMRNFLREVDPAAYSVWRKEQFLMKACESGDLDKVKRLVGSGISVKCKDRYGWTPMLCAVSGGYEEVAAWLFLSGASVTDKDTDGWAPVHYAAHYGYKEIAEWLISVGASIHDEDKRGRTALHLADSSEMRDFLRITDPSAYSVWEKEQELIGACKRGDLDEVRRLAVDSGVSVTCRDRDGDTPMHWAVIHCHKEVAVLLFSLGASVSDKDEDGRTALFCAARIQNKDIARLLIDIGAAVDQQEVRRALNYVCRGGNREFAALLTQHLRWLSRRDFLMFLATQSYLLPVPPPLADTMSSEFFRDELNASYQMFHNPEARPNTAVHSVFFMEELQRYIMSFLGPE